jgi:hypothetical protein
LKWLTPWMPPTRKALPIETSSQRTFSLLNVVDGKSDLVDISGDPSGFAWRSLRRSNQRYPFLGGRSYELLNALLSARIRTNQAHNLFFNQEGI